MEAVTWYQFKIPLREYDEKVGNIRNFKSVRFIRMFMTNFEKEKHLRFATLELVRGEWRNYSKNIYQIGTTPISNGDLDVQAVNIEENSDKTPVNYVLPPGVTRETDPGQVALLKLNEQSMVLKVKNLAPNDARAVYKNTAYDMRQYKRLQMFVHAEKLLDDLSNLKDYDLSCFIRLGSDLLNNYYEYEIPLKLTPEGVYSQSSDEDRATVWYQDNMFDFPFEVLTKAKTSRNRSKQDGSYISDFVPIYHNGKNKIRVVGNPSISNVENIMIGIRNNSTNGEVKSGEIWVNELRMTEFDEDGGSAAMGNLAVGLSDLGSINLSGRVETAGYGSIESNVMDRRMDDLYQMNFSTNINLGRFLPEKAKIQLPAYFSYTNETLTPKYNPLDEDVLLSEALDTYIQKEDKDTLLMNSQTVNSTKSFNISSAKVNIKSKKPQFYDPANVSFTYAYSESNQHSAEVKENMIKQERAAINYSFSFGNEPIEPFKKSKALEKPAFKIIKDFNFNYLPSSLSFNTDMNRQFSKIELRDFTGMSSPANFDLNFSKDFMWNRNFSINYDLSRAIKFSLQTAMNANIEEPEFTPEIGKEHYEAWRDTVWSKIKELGTPYAYNQVFTASWNLPINKIPYLEWINSNVAYNSNYSWNRTALINGDKVGNIASSMSSMSGDASFNFETLYAKSNYLKEVNKKFANQNTNTQKFQPKNYSETIKLESNKKITVNHRLGSQKFDFVARDKQGKVLVLDYKAINATALEINSYIDLDSVTISLVTKDPNQQTMAQKVTDMTAGFLLMTRRASVTYRKTNSMTLPGFTPEPGFLGQEKISNGMLAPGYGFAFGFFNDDFNDPDNIVQEAKDKGWLYTSESIVSPAISANTSDLDIKANFEPIPGMKIDLNAKRYTASNTTIQYMFDGMPKTFNGSYNITQIALATAFKPTGDASQNYASEVFDNFLGNRQKIADRLNKQLVGTDYPSTGFFADDANISGKKYDSDRGSYGLNSADVLIPAFLAAYTGRDVNTVDTNPFLPLINILPNWRMNYDGLSRISWIKEKVRSLSITHAYTSRYSIGNYTSFSTWVAMSEDNSALGYIRDVQTNNPIPSSPYDIASVSLNEQFSPLLGINAVMKNSMTAKFEFRKQRNLSLNLSSTQLIESSSDEWVAGIGYVLKDFDVIMKLKNNTQTKVKNDLKLNADVSVKNIKSLLRKIDENITQASSGNKMFSLKVIADYVFSSKVNVQLFFDHQTTAPLISSTYPVSATNFGMSFKFMLTR
jgi:cell surface protein SprA